MNTEIKVKLTGADRRHIKMWFDRLGLPMPEPSVEEKVDDINDALADTAMVAAENAISLEDVYTAILDLGIQIAEIKEQLNA